MYYTKRPSPYTYAAAGGAVSIGLVALTARGIDALTTFNLAFPLGAVCFVVGVLGVLGGGSFSAWLIVRALKHQVAALRAENTELRDELKHAREIRQMIADADAQGEVNAVLIKKVLAAVQDQRAANTNGDTQPIPLLHAIKGKGGA